MKSRISLNVSVGAALVIASTLVWIACGTSAPTSATSEDGGGGGGSSGGSGSGSSSSGAGGSSSGSSGGNSSSGAGSSGGSSGSSSGTSSGSSSGGSTDAGTACPQVACPSGETCCADLVNQDTTCSASCAPDDTVACTGTADCANEPDAGMCCATAILNKGPDGGNSFPHGCSVESVNSFCGKCLNAPLALGMPSLTCQTNGDASVEHVHVCSSTADCAGEPTNKLCCPVFSYNICLSSLLAGIGQVTCMP